MDDMKKCTQCGAELPSDALFCSECGGRQTVGETAPAPAEPMGAVEPAAVDAMASAAPESPFPSPQAAAPQTAQAPVAPAAAAAAIGLQYTMPSQPSMDPFAAQPAAPQPAQPAMQTPPQTMQSSAFATQQPPYPAPPTYPAQGMAPGAQQAWQQQQPYPGQPVQPAQPVPQPGKKVKAPKQTAQPAVPAEGGASAKKLPIPTLVLLGLSLVILVIWFLLYNSPNLPEFDFSAATANAAVFSYLLMSILAVVGAVLFRFQLRGKKLAVLGDVFIGIVMLVMLYGMSITVLSEKNIFYKLFIGITGG